MFGEDEDPADDFSDEDDCDFYRLQSNDEIIADRGIGKLQGHTLPADEVDFSDEDTSDEEVEEESENGKEASKESSEHDASDHSNYEEADSAPGVEFQG